MLPPRFHEWALGDRVGLRSDHPWNSNLPPWDLSEPSPTWPNDFVTSESASRVLT
jgi:hypothetical protein